ncbi:uncharacterized protein LOC128335748 isoform X1 [Hemicordylus capensis]|uniref:uncharacterized protein LOC128335424 isoform X1 n=1 Tax=Hemicordylus capensis TaxID=884348 RepID=UPI002303892F|nr:uncharacterized protein LOC128335424 isoform X1 [Hemicordylus capensis]XP_053130451.1 uncharacterized protein LOC128335748 isoform X1 [Hemicordylus capensis]
MDLECKTQQLLGLVRLSENGEQGGKEAKEKENGLDAIGGEGCPPQPPIQAETQADVAAAKSGGPEGPGTTPATPLPAETLAPKDAQPAGGLFPLSAPAPLFSHPDVKVLTQKLEAVREFQSQHHRERKRDLRSCRDCLRSIRTIRDHLQTVKSRLSKVEARLGIQVPLQELDPEDREEEEEKREQDPSPPDPETQEQEGVDSRKEHQN